MLYLPHGLFVHFRKDELPPILEINPIEVFLRWNAHYLDHLEYNISIGALQERKLTLKHVDHQTAKTPNVSSFLKIPQRLQNNLGRANVTVALIKVILRVLFTRIFDVGKVSDGCFQLVSQHYVVRIEISVADVSGVDVIQSFENLE